MRNKRKYLLLVLVLILVAFAFKTAEAQNGGEEVFPGNYILKGKFLEYYRSVPEAQLLFGNAISDEKDMNGTPVQYFDRARFELVETDHGSQVQLAQLGYFVYDESTTQPIDETFPSSTCRYFPKYGHRVCYSFLQFYDEHNGQEYFGSPLSDMVIENGQYVQYFDNARFEYRFNMPPDMRVGLTNIGLLEMIKLYGRGQKLTSNIGSGNLPEVTAANRIQARAFVSRALVAPGSPNTLFVVVQLPDYTGVAKAKVNVSVVIGDKITSLPTAETDEDGIARFELPGYDLASRETVQLQAIVNSGNQTITTSTWFRIWY
jgi:hypothetical protein